MWIEYSGNRPPSLRWLLAGLTVGYGGLVLWQGLRLVVLITGGAITAAAITAWYCFPKPQSRNLAASSTNLLELEVWRWRLANLEPLLPTVTQPQWQKTVQQAVAIHPLVTQIAQQEPTFIPDLIETLHTVLELVDQLSRALQTTQRVQMPHYQALAQQQLRRSQTRLQQTHEQLRELHDQLMLTDLTQRSQSIVSGISIRLQLITAENAQSLLESPE